MFTGLVELKAQVTEILPDGSGKRLTIRHAGFAGQLAVGDSVSVSGCCLTVVAVADDVFSFEAGSETLSCTTLGRLQLESEVNLEQSLAVGDTLGGHFVTGHVDDVGQLTSRSDDGEWSEFRFSVPERLTGQMACKGSVAVDGVSLTLVEVEKREFSIALIPHTLSVTTLGSLRPGDEVNIETDILAKYVAQQVMYHSS
ncbi:MAG: riboflavin synthase [Planctomycetaceae bacterium]|jgi:riboflavin synthase|nr:riboflavin synthase [Planctomycetaceae bacterium]